MLQKFSTDEYGEVTNSDMTFCHIAKHLVKASDSIMIGWTDENGTHFDIMFTLGAMPVGRNIQGGINPAKDLIVSIMRQGSFAFRTDRNDTHYGYYAEKLGIGGKVTGEMLGELINGVISELKNYE